MRALLLLCLAFTASCDLEPFPAFPASAFASLQPPAILPLLGSGLNGQACGAGTDCASGFCVDGVCCNTACGGGVTTDCQACSWATGAKVDGTCSLRLADTICRAPTSDCDPPEMCDGVTPNCPADVKVPDGSVCSQPCWGPQFGSNICKASVCTGVLPARGVGAICLRNRQNNDMDCHGYRYCDGVGACAPEALAPVGAGCRLWLTDASCGHCDANARCAGPYARYDESVTICPGL